MRIRSVLAPDASSPVVVHGFRDVAIFISAPVDDFADASHGVVHAVAIRVEIGGAFALDPDVFGALRGIYICAQEHEIPVIDVAFEADHVAYLLCIEFTACIFIAVCDDDKDHLMRLLVLRGVSVDMDEALYGFADGIIEGGAAAREIRLVREFCDAVDRFAVVNDLDFVVEEDGRDDCMFGIFFCSVRILL